MYLRILFWISLLLTGGYYEGCSALISCGLLIWLLIRAKKQGLRLKVNDAVIAAFAISAFYFLTIIWAVDRGTAVWGAVKFLPLPLFVLGFLQLEKEERDRLLYDVPVTGAFMTVLSVLLQFFPVFKSSLVVNGRLAGFFQYPNTYAAFLMAGILVLVLKPDLLAGRVQDRKAPGIYRLILLLVLSFGLAASGSRAVMAMGAVMMIVSLIAGRKEYPDAGAWIRLFLPLIVGLAAGLLIGHFAGGSAAGHLSAGSASTFWGRIIYAQDALGQIVKHPFGTGFLGYYFSQGSFQTALYSVRWVHNDLLQLLLDVGWIPAVLLVIAVVKALRSKNRTAFHKLLLVFFLLHGLVDFDFQFLSFWMLLFSCLDLQEDFRKRKQDLPKPGKRTVFFAAALAGAAVLGLGSLYIGLASTVTYFGSFKTAEQIYPPNTLAQVSLLMQADTAEEMDAYADRILSRNPFVAIAWDARAEAAYSRGQVGEMMESKRKALSLNPYEESEYEDYRNKLDVIAQYYQSENDRKGLAAIVDEQAWLAAFQESVAKQTSPLADRLE